MSMTKWTLDPAHSEVLFKVKHLMITNVTGRFEDFSVEAETEGEDFLKSNIRFSARTASVNTKNEQRDAHLRSADFFDSENYPEMHFVATGYTDVDHDGSYNMEGDLTIRNITRRIQVAVEYGGLMKDPWGNVKAGFTISGKFNRKDFELNWNAALETGGLLVSDEVRISIEVQLAKQ